MPKPVDPWPPAVETFRFPYKVQFTLERTTLVPKAGNPRDRDLQKSHIEGEVHLTKDRIWVRSEQVEMPWDEVRVHQRGERPVQFQIDAKDQMTIQPTGLFVAGGMTPFFVGEPFGWSDVSPGSAPKGTLRDTLAQFRIKSVENGVYRGVNSKGIEVEIATELQGTRIRRIEFREITPAFQITRKTQYTRWNTGRMGRSYIPLEGVCSLQTYDSATGQRFSDTTAFKISGFRLAKDPEAPPFQEGMIFRQLKGTGKPAAFRYEKGKYVPTTDPGNVFIPGRIRPQEPVSPVPILLALLFLAAGLGLIWRNYRRHQRLAKA